MNAAIAVLMPCFNAAEFLREAIAGVLGQTHGDLELLIADDGSTDSSREIVASMPDPRIRYLEMPAHQGYLRTCNFLFNQVRTPFFAFQDADDISEPARFERQLRVFRDMPEIHLCTTDYHRINRDGSIRVTRRWPTDYAQLRWDASVRMQICKASILARSGILNAIPTYREFFDGKGGEDIDWVYRIIERYPAFHLPEVLYRYRVHFSRAKAEHRSIYRHYVIELVESLRQSRLATGSDWLIDGNSAKLNLLLAELEQPFRADPSFIHRLESRDMVRFGHFSAALTQALSAVRRRPLFWENYRNLGRSLSAMVGAGWKQ